MLLVAGKVCECLERCAELVEVCAVGKDLSLHLIRITERYALEICEQVEVCGNGRTEASARQGAQSILVIGKGLCYVPASVAKSGEGGIERVAIVRIVIALPSAGLSAKNAEIYGRNVGGILAQIPILELAPLHIKVNVGVGVIGVDNFEAGLHKRLHRATLNGAAVRPCNAPELNENVTRNFGRAVRNIDLIVPHHHLFAKIIDDVINAVYKVVETRQERIVAHRQEACVADLALAGARGDAGLTVDVVHIDLVGSHMNVLVGEDLNELGKDIFDERIAFLVANANVPTAQRLAAVFLVLGVAFEVVKLFGQVKAVRRQINFGNDVNAKEGRVGDDLTQIILGVGGAGGEGKIGINVGEIREALMIAKVQMELVVFGFCHTEDDSPNLVHRDNVTRRVEHNTAEGAIGIIVNQCFIDYELAILKANSLRKCCGGIDKTAIVFCFNVNLAVLALQGVKFRFFVQS